MRWQDKRGVEGEGSGRESNDRRRARAMDEAEKGRSAKETWRKRWCVSGETLT